MKAASRLLCSLGLFLGMAVNHHAAITGTVDTIGGSFTRGYVDGDNSVSLFNQPNGLAVDSAGRLYVADYGNNAIRRIEGELTSTFATIGVNGPVGLAIDSVDRVLVANLTGGTLVRIDPSGLGSTTIAAGLSLPTAVTLDGSGNIYVAQLGGSIIRYTAAGVSNMTYTVSQGTPAFRGLAVASDGTLIVSDAGNHVLWKVPISGAGPTLFAGTFGSRGFAEGGAGFGRLNSPQHISMATNGVVVVADLLNHRIRAVNNDGVISTLYGVDPSAWEGLPESSLPGWADGPSAQAELREPVGVVVDRNNSVFDAEIFYSVIRKATGLTFPTNAVAGPNPGGGGGSPGANRMSLGFASGEASSDFFGAPGQRFIAPVTLTVGAGVKMYSLQFNLMVTNANAGTPTGNYSAGFDSTIYRRSPVDPTRIQRLPPQMYVGSSANVSTQLIANGVGTRVIIYSDPGPNLASLIVTNGFGNFLGVGWIERFGETNLYDTILHDLIHYSQPHDYTFISDNGRVVPGGFSFSIPTNATPDSVYRVSVGRPSATGDGIASDAVIEAPDGSDTTLGISAVRLLRIATRKYLVGDVLPFRWFNAGDFGDGSILNNDVAQLQEMFVYGYNFPPLGSDMYDALDSCCFVRNPDGSRGADLSQPANFQLADKATLDSIGYGDGVLTIEDFYVSFRRALDPGLVNFERFWSGGERISQVTSNVFRGVEGAVSSTLQFAAKPKKSPINKALLDQPITAKFVAGKLSGSAGQTVRAPIDVITTGPLGVRSLRLQFSVRTLDGAAPLQSSIAFANSDAVGNPTFGGVSGNTHFAATWFELSAPLPAGTHRIGTIDFQIPSTATADTLFAVNIEAAEASSGLTRFPVTIENGIVFMSNRAAAPWNDEIPDNWRIQYFGSLMNVLSAPEADADGDGLTTLEEYRAGTNPNDTLSSFALQGGHAGRGISIKWPTVSGKHYRLEASPAVGEATWTTIEDQINGTGGTIERLRAYSGDARFYRVVVIE